MAELKTFPKGSDSADTYIKAADERLQGIRKLGAKPEKRWFGIGPKKKLTAQDKEYQKVLSRDELRFRATGMAKRRAAKGLGK